jgi:hypothetical protein
MHSHSLITNSEYIEYGFVVIVVLAKSCTPCILVMIELLFALYYMEEHRLPERNAPA